MKQAYLATIVLLERMHRQFLEVLKTELDQQGVRDINNVQALILYNIGKEEMTVGELTLRGYYLGSNVSYNVKKMTEHGYLQQQRSPHDRRSVRVSLSDKGLELWKQLDVTFDHHVTTLTDSVENEVLTSANASLRQLERFWLHKLGFGPRVADFSSLTSAA